MKKLTILLRQLGLVSAFIGISSSLGYAEPHAHSTHPTRHAITIAKRINRVMRPLLESGDIVGAEVGVYQNGHVQFFSYGQTAIDGGAPTPETVYQIASITKVFTATLLAESVVDGKVKLQDPIDKYLPRGVRLQPDVRNTVTFQDLATHTAGFPDYPPANIHTRWQFMHQYLPQWQPNTPPGTHYEYSDLGFELLADLVAHINQKSFESLLVSEINKPLGMTATNTVEDQASVPNVRAMGYNKRGYPVPYSSDTWNRIAFLTSTASDLMKFIQANLGVIPVPPRLAQAIAMTHKTYFRIRPNAKLGLAWQIHTLPRTGATVFWKNGGLEGFGSFIGFNPATKTGIVMLASWSKMNDSSNTFVANKLTARGIRLLSHS